MANDLSLSWSQCVRSLFDVVMRRIVERILPKACHCLDVRFLDAGKRRRRNFVRDHRRQKTKKIRFPKLDERSNSEVENDKKGNFWEIVENFRILLDVAILRPRTLTVCNAYVCI